MALVVENVSIRLKPKAVPFWRRTKPQVPLTLIENMSFSVAPGEILTLAGPSGVGKSTLLAFISGHLDENFLVEGRVICDGTDITNISPENRRMGMLFQDDLLFPHLSVGENLSFGLSALVRGKAERKLRIEAALADASLPGFEHRDPATLSGGQRARIALMRALLCEPRALLLDEPFGKLDASLRSDIREFVFSHARREKLPVVMVTHDMEDAEASLGPMIRLQAHQEAAACNVAY